MKTILQQKREDKRKTVIMLAYGTLKPKPRAKKLMHYSAISKALNMPYNRVHHICRAALKGIITGER